MAANYTSTGLHALVLLALVMSCNVCLMIAADCTIQNASYTAVVVDGRPVVVGQIVTIGIEDGMSTTTVDLAYARTVTGIRVKDGQEYFIIDNQTAGTGFVHGRPVRTLDLVEGRKILSSF